MKQREPVGIMVVEDSATVREYLVGLFSSQPDLKIVATARNGQRAMDMLKAIPRPDIITMDIHMPVMDGLNATKSIMGSFPAPILVVSSGPEAEEGTLVLKALEAGALGAVRLPPGRPASPERVESERRLLESVRLLSEVRVVRRWTSHSAPGQAKGMHKPAAAEPLPAPVLSGFPQVVAIGASTGGPLAVKTVLKALPPGFPLPILLVQHMATGFTQSFVDWLREECAREVELAREGAALRPGLVLVAPERMQMEITPARTVRLAPAGSGNPHAPSVSRLFQSVEKVFGPTAIAVLLTGMGRDGAEELAGLKRSGALTLVQDEESSAVHGMPGEAIRLGGASYVLSPSSIGEMIERAARR